MVNWLLLDQSNMSMLKIKFVTMKRNILIKNIHIIITTTCVNTYGENGIPFRTWIYMNDRVRRKSFFDFSRLALFHWLVSCRYPLSEMCPANEKLRHIKMSEFSFNHVACVNSCINFAFPLLTHSWCSCILFKWVMMINNF